MSKEVKKKKHQPRSRKARGINEANFVHWLNIYPNEEERIILNKYFRDATEIWNWTVDHEREYYKAYGTILSGDYMRKLLTDKRNENPEKYNTISRSLQTCTIESVISSFKSHITKKNNGDKNSRPPRKRNQICRTIQIEKGWKVKDRVFYLNKTGKGGKGKNSRILSCIIHGNVITDLEFANQCFIRINKYNEYQIGLIYRLPLNGLSSQSDNPVGYDWGCNNLIVDQFGQSVTTPKFLTSKEKLKIRKLQRSLRRKNIHSHSYQKTLDRINRIRRKELARKKEFMIALSKHITSIHDAVFVEDLNFNTMKSGLKHGKNIQSVSPSQFFGWIRWQCLRQDKLFLAVSPWNTSKTCSDCGSVNADLTLNDKEWICPECGSHHDRDINAARNILIKGAEKASHKNISVNTGSLQLFPSSTSGEYRGTKTQVGVDLRSDRLCLSSLTEIRC